MTNSNNQHDNNSEEKKPSASSESSGSSSELTQRQLKLLKYFSLVALTINASAFVLLTRYSRIIKYDYDPLDNSKNVQYLTSTAVVCSEILKCVTSLIVVWVLADYSFIQTWREINTDIIKKPYETGKMLIPSILFTIQNNLLYVGLSNLDATTFQAMNQMKILTTALFSVWLLKKKLDKYKWTSLVILMVGVICVQLPKTETSQSGVVQLPNQQLIGLFAVIFSCFSSGFASIYLEKFIKTGSTTIWIVNIQLGLFSTIMGMVNVVVKDYEPIIENGFFQGYHPIVWCAVCSQALGGLVVAAVSKYADNILKGFAVALSVILTSFFSYFLLKDLVVDQFLVLGCFLVIISSFMYGIDKQKLLQLLRLSKPQTRKNNDTEMLISTQN